MWEKWACLSKATGHAHLADPFWHTPFTVWLLLILDGDAFPTDVTIAYVHAYAYTSTPLEVAFAALYVPGLAFGCL